MGFKNFFFLALFFTKKVARGTISRLQFLYSEFKMGCILFSPVICIYCSFKALASACSTLKLVQFPFLFARFAYCPPLPFLIATLDSIKSRLYGGCTICPIHIIMGVGSALQRAISLSPERHEVIGYGE